MALYHRGQVAPSRPRSCLARYRFRRFAAVSPVASRSRTALATVTRSNGRAACMVRWWSRIAVIRSGGTRTTICSSLRPFTVADSRSFRGAPVAA